MKIIDKLIILGLGIPLTWMVEVKIFPLLICIYAVGYLVKKGIDSEG